MNKQDFTAVTGTTSEIEDLELEEAIASLDDSAKPHQGEILPARQVAQPLKEAEFYSKISMSTIDVKDLKDTAERIRSIHRHGVLLIGEELVRIKKCLNGNFDAWIAHEFTMSRSTAYNYISVFEALGSMPELVDGVPASAAYLLAEKSTPEAARKQIAKDIQAGKKFSLNDVKAVVKDARIVERCAKRADDEEKYVQKLVAKEKRVIERTIEEGEASKKIDALAWQQRERELIGTGKSGEEIKAEQKKWDSVTAQKQREEERQRERERKNVLNNLERQKVESHERSRKANEQASEIAKLILNNFTGDRAKLSELLNDLVGYLVVDKLKEALID